MQQAVSGRNGKTAWFRYRREHRCTEFHNCISTTEKHLTFAVKAKKHYIAFFPYIIWIFAFPVQLFSCCHALQPLLVDSLALLIRSSLKLLPESQVWRVLIFKFEDGGCRCCRGIDVSEMVFHCMFSKWMIWTVSMAACFSSGVAFCGQPCAA